MGVVAILCGLVLIYLTILFIVYSAKEKKTTKQSQVGRTLTYTKYL